MEQSPSTSGTENLSDKELAELRATLRELAADLPGTIARFRHNNPDAAREYDEAAQSCIRAREVVHSREGLIVIY